jgi:soluble lytic murein transglycosylase-like protein
MQLDKLAAQRAYADSISAIVENYDPVIEYWADFYGTPADEIKQTIQCESRGDPTAVGDSGESLGLAQIHLPDHPNITISEALDPYFSIKYMASHWYSDHWTCAKLLGFYAGE